MFRTRFFLNLRSEVKVTVIQKQYATPSNSKMYTHAQFGVPISNNLGMLWAYFFLKVRPVVNVTIVQNQYATIWEHKMYQHTKYRIHMSNNIGDMLRTQLF